MNEIIRAGMESIGRAKKENPKLRTRSGKTFDLGGGKYQAMIFADPIHYWNEELRAWIEIDNTLFESGENGNREFINRDNPEMKVSFSNSAEPDMITIEDEEGHILSWGFEKARKVFPERLADCEQKKSGGKMISFPESLNMIEANVLYSAIYEGVDLACSIHSITFKDEIRFEHIDSIASITITLSLKGLTPFHRRDGDIDLLSDDGTILYTFPKPFLKDSSVEGTFGEVDQILERGETRGKWKITYNPNKTWLQEAKFPVILDPAVISKKHSSAIEDNFITSANPSTVQPYAGTSMTISKGSNNWGTSKSFIRFLDSGLPSVDSSYYVTSAYFSILTATTPTTAATVYLKEVLGAWNSQTITYNNAPSLNEKPLDYSYMNSAGTWYSFDISNLVRKWYGGENYGIALEAASNTYFSIFSSDHAYYKPYLIINYVSLAGIQGYLAYEEQSIGRAGIGRVSLYNGNLIFEHRDSACGGQRMPVSISHFYNSCYRMINDFGCGYGWKMNIQQTLHKETLTDTNGDTTYYVYMDATGTRHHFKNTSGEWKDLSGKGMKLTISGSTATITDKADNAMVFDLPTVEFADNYANVKMIKSISDSSGNTITVSSSGCLVNNVEDGAGRNTGIALVAGKVDTIYPPGYGADGVCWFTYSSNGYMTKICELADQDDTAELLYGYDSHGLLVSVVNRDGLTATYDYITSREPYRVSRVRITGGTLTAMDCSYDYKDCLTVVTDNITGKKLFYHFNDYGNVISVNDELGYAAFSQYDEEYPVNHPKAISRLQRSIVNLFMNHNFETSSAWNLGNHTSGNTLGYTTDTCYLGKRCIKATIGENIGMCTINQNINLEKGKTYTLSFYAKRSGNIDVWIQISVGGSTFYSPSLIPQLSSEFTRVSFTFTVPATVASTYAYIYIIAGSAIGTVWLDCAQLEEGPVANRYNLLNNGDFTANNSATPYYWTANSTNDGNDIVYTSSSGSKPVGLSINTMRLYGGGRTKYAGIYQDIPISGDEGDVYVAGGWSIGYSMPRKGEDHRYNIRVSFLKTGTSTRESSPSIEWSEEWTDWQFAAGPIVAPCNYTSIRFNIDYERNINYAEFNGLFLHKEEFGQTFVYDSKGNIISAKSAASLQDGATYDNFNNVSTYYQPGRSSDQTIMEWGTTDAEKKKHLLRKSTSPLGIITEYTYDNYGNQLKSLISDGTNFVKYQTIYDADGNHVFRKMDARCMITEYEVDDAKDILKSVIDPRGSSIVYEYDSDRRMIKSSYIIEYDEYRNEYKYTLDKLTEVRHSTSNDGAEDVVYYFTYDAVGMPLEVKVGTQVLSHTYYNEDGTVADVSFGNGGSVQNAYDDYKRLIEVRYDEAEDARFIYTYGANGEIAQLKDTERNVTVTSEYDIAGRPQRKTIMEGNIHCYTGEASYDEYGNLKKFNEKVGYARTAYSTTFTYDNENRPIQIDFGLSRQIIYTYDGIGRIIKKVVSLGNFNIQTNYEYMSGGWGTGSTTPLVQNLTQLGTTLTYTYDEAGNIISVADGTKTIEYVYDGLGQLIWTYDPYDTTAGSSGTCWYTHYDLGGNIAWREADIYSAGVPGATVQTIPYEYGDTNWRDKLTAYNGIGITYDAIGNPLYDGTWTYNWAKGRQLQQMAKNGETVSFVYNEDGLRVEKISTISGATKYTLHGKNIVHISHGSSNLHFFYDAKNKPVIVEYNGASYAYIYNLQGDVIALVDGNGNIVVMYSYDSWGKLLNTTGQLATTLGYINPFRYNGYTYDEETQLYYLENRYYCPERCRFISAENISNDNTYNLFSYCNDSPIIHRDSRGNIAEEIDEVDLTTDEEIFEMFIMPKINTYLENPADYGYDSNGYKEAVYNTNGKLNEAGYSDCSHLMYELTGVGSYTANYRYTQYEGKKGKLFNRNGKLAVELQVGMEVYQRDSSGNYFHVGMLIRWDFMDGNGKVWAVFQSTSVINITKSINWWNGKDKNAGPTVTSFFQKDGKTSKWKYYTAPRYLPMNEQ